jgi:hypothetical protein
MNMKAYLDAALMLALVFLTFALAGCADQPTTASASAGNPTDRTYSRNDLNRTGRQSTGEAIQAADPSVTVSGGGRR